MKENVPFFFNVHKLNCCSIRIIDSTVTIAAVAHKQLKARNVSTAGAVHQSVIPDTFDSLSSQQRIIKLKVTQYFHAYHYIILTEV